MPPDAETSEESSNNERPDRPLHEEIALSRRSILATIAGAGMAVGYAAGERQSRFETAADDSLYAAGFTSSLTDQKRRDEYVSAPTSAFDKSTLETNELAVVPDDFGIGVKNANGDIEVPNLGSQANPVPSVTTDVLDTKGRPVHSVTAYGAVGDGTTDDSTAIADAITAADADDGIVYFSSNPGDYYIASKITVTNVSNVTFRGDGNGSIIRADDVDIPGFVVDNSDHITIERLRLIGNSGAAGDNTGVAIKDGCDYPIVRYCWIEDWSYDGINSLDGNKGALFAFNTVLNTGDDGINPGGGTTADATQHRVLGNYIEGVTNDCIHISQSSKRTLVAGNICVGGTRGIAAVVDAANARITGNVVYNGTRGIDVNGSTVSNIQVTDNTVVGTTNQGIRFSNGDDCLIEGNAVIDCGASHSLFIGSSGTTAKVCGNYIVGKTGVNGIHADAAAYIDGNFITGADRGIEATTDCPIRNNDLEAIEDFGIVISESGTSSAAQIMGNTIYGSVNNNGIFVDASDLRIIANVLDTADINISGGNDNVLENNDAAGGVSDSGTRTVIDGEATESANAETPQADYSATRPLHVDFTDSGDGSGNGVYYIDAGGTVHGAL